MAQKLHIKVYQNGLFKGYVQSVSYTRDTFRITTDICKAKGYASDDSVQREIDKLTIIGFAYGYVFGY